jgi:precorrin-6Y C5,15-methyltransferase (decarboxylating)
MLANDGRERLTWPRGALTDLIPEIKERNDRAVCVLATGDPMFYGIGVKLAGHIAAEEMTVVPSPSAFALACARLGWPRAEVETLSLHGRPPALVESYIQPGARLVILSDGAETPGTVAEILRARGYGASRLTVLEHMGGVRERTLAGLADDWAVADVAPFNTLAVDCVATPDAALLPRVPGLPDDAYRHDGQLTKREVRAATLAALAPVPGQRLWDVGAGAGSVAIEWMRAHPTCAAIAIERDPDRVRMIADNATSLGAPKLDVVAGEAPAALDGLAPPDAVFVGGGAAAPGLMEACWRALAPGGRLVANAITVEGEATLYRWRAETGGSLTRIAVSRAEPVGGFAGWRALAPVTQLTVVKS